MSKLTKTEQRCKEYCEELHRLRPHQLPVGIITKWSRNHHPSIRNGCGELLASAGGYGCDKRSAVFAQLFEYLGRTPEERKHIRSLACHGVGAIQDALKECGWKLEWLTADKRVDVYIINRKGE